jgi:multidrug resistance efflux pump
MSYGDVERIDVPGGWIYHGHPLPNPVLVSDPAFWTLNESTARTLSAQLATLNTKVTSIMASIADVQAALAANESKEATIIGLLQTEAQLQKDTLAQLTALQSAGTVDPVALDGIVAKMTADSASMDAAIASITPTSASGATGASSASGTTGATGTDTPPATA